MIGAGVGISAWLLLLLVHNADIESMNMLVAGLGAGIIVFLIGIGIIINAFFFTLPTKQLPAPILDKVPDVLDTSGCGAATFACRLHRFTYSSCFSNRTHNSTPRN
jgi:hypothetical protein